MKSSSWPWWFPVAFLFCCRGISADDDGILIVGGFSNGGRIADSEFLEFNSGNENVFVEDFPFEHEGGVAAVLGGKYTICGGVSGQNEQVGKT